MIRLRVGALIFRENPEPEILLVQHRRRGRSYSVLPGGKPESMETIEETFVREVYEETGLEVKMGCLVFIADVIDPHHDLHVINLVFQGLITGGTFRPAPTGSFSPIENQDHAYFLPLSSLGKERIYPAIAASIQKAYEMGFPTDALYLGNVWAAFADESAADVNSGTADARKLADERA